MTRPSLVWVFLLSGACVSAADDAFEMPPIRYSETRPTDRIARLEEALRSGKVDLDPKLAPKEFVGRLLEILEVPAASQVLVFSKSSLQISHINPRTPRAIYFSDDLYFGWTHGSDQFEIISTDPQLGCVFYLIERDAAEKAVRVERESGRCFSCHVSGRTGQVPGMVVRSLHVEESGQPIFSAGGFYVDHTTPFEDRWGGWYVTGSHGDARHLGNLVSVAKPDGSAIADQERGANLTSLEAFINPSEYLVPTSDLIALVVLEHQATMHNLLTEGNFTVRSAIHRCHELYRELGDPDPNRLSDSCQRIIANQAERILSAMLFTDEAPLPEGGIDSRGSFMAAFGEAGIPSREGRSLRDFQLLDRIFKYRCSYMIYSEAFASLPPELRDAILARLDAVLQGREPDGLGRHLSDSERGRIREILVDTLPAFSQNLAETTP